MACKEMGKGERGGGKKRDGSEEVKKGDGSEEVKKGKERGRKGKKGKPKQCIIKQFSMRRRPYHQY